MERNLWLVKFSQTAEQLRMLRWTALSEDGLDRILVSASDCSISDGYDSPMVSLNRRRGNLDARIAVLRDKNIAQDITISEYDCLLNL